MVTPRIVAPRPGRPNAPDFLVSEMGDLVLHGSSMSVAGSAEGLAPGGGSGEGTSISPSPPTTPSRSPVPSGSVRGWDSFLRRVRSTKDKSEKPRKHNTGAGSSESAGEEGDKAGSGCDCAVPITKYKDKDKDKRGSFSFLDRIRKPNGKRSRENSIVGHHGIGGVRAPSPDSSSGSGRESDSSLSSRHKRPSSSLNTEMAFGGKYSPIRVLGRGIYGVVYLCRERTGEKRSVAVKTVPAHLLAKPDCRKLMEQIIMERETLRLIQREPRDASKNTSELTDNAEASAVLQNGPSPYLVQMFRAFHDPFYTFIVLECVEGGDMFTFLHERGRMEGLGADITRMIAAEITCALEFLHFRDIVYRDLKPENVLLTKKGHIKLTDFGFCKSVFGSKRRTTHQVCGTLQYLSPECIWQTAHGQEADYWALGVLIHEMLSLTTPFDDALNKYEVMTVITSGDIPIAEEIYDVSPEAYDLVSRMLDPRKSERIGWCPKQHLIYEHCFFRSINWDDIRLNRVPMPGWVEAPSRTASNDTIGSQDTDAGSESPSVEDADGAMPDARVLTEYCKWAQGVVTEKDQKHYRQIMAAKFDSPISHRGMT